MSTKAMILYVFIALAGIAVGVLATLSLTSTSTAPAAHTEDDGHGHGAVAAVASSSGQASDWCAEHSVPESVCTLCNADLVAKFKDSGDWCGEHGIPESHCRLCNPEIRFPQEELIVETPEMFVSPDVYFPANAGKCETDRAIIQFTSAETVQRAGITMEPALGSSHAGTVLDIPAELEFDETRTKMLTLSIPATVVRWLAEPGRIVNRGTDICEADSPEMARLQSEYLAVKTEWQVDQQVMQRADSLFAARLISASEYEEITGEAAMTLARLNGFLGQLRAAGMSESQIDQIPSAGISSHWTVEAGMDGALLERRAALGMLLEAGSTIAVVGDPNSLWVQAHVRERDAGRVTAGRRIEFAADGAALDRIRGEVFWVAQFVDPQTRTVMVRARVQGDGRLARANRFGRMLISGDHSQESVMIPKDAVQWEGCCNVVFIADAGNKFRPRKVEIERGDRSHYRVSSGINAGEMVVVGGSYLLKTELMKGSMGTGCCGLEPES
ncbi:MAG: efflux RND transporter periplasmic adaptor subunit [Candidatus Zixiibacteriota bacterium]